MKSNIYKKLLKSTRRGYVLPLVMLTVVVLLIVGTGFLRLALDSRIFSIRMSSAIAARSAADAGLNKALYEMGEKLKIKPWDGNSLPLATNWTLPNCSSVFNYSVTGDIFSGYTVESTGKYNYAARKVQCALKLQGPFEYAIYGVQGVEFKNSAEVDWYNFNDGDENMKVGTSSVESGAISLKNSATINGDVVVGLGGNPDDVIDLKNSAEITGQTLAMTVEEDLPPVIVPEWLQLLSSMGTLQDGNEINTSRKYDAINLGNSEEITIAGNITLYIAGDLILKNSAKIVVNDDSSLVLYVQGKLEGKNSSSFNNESQDPKKLKIFGLDECEEMRFKNGSEFYGVIYAPNADVEFDNSADAYGSVIAKNFEQKNSAKFSYDASLGRSASADDPAVHFKISDWAED